MLSRAAPDTDRRGLVVLAFDTAGSACSVAVGRGGGTLAQERREMRHGHAEALLPMIDRVMAAAGLRAADLDALAATVGPGGFTGIRAGLAAAQGLALAANARLIGITSFAAVAAIAPGDETALLVALDSRRQDLYVQLFERDGRAAGEPVAILPADLSAFVAASVGAAPLRLAGDAAEAAAAALAGRADIAVVAGTAPNAGGALAAAWPLLAAAPPPARPLYLRPPDVSFPKARREKASLP